MFKRLTTLLLVLVLLIASGCGDKKAQKEKPIQVYLWSIELLREYAPYVQSQLPDIDIQFVVGNNDLEYYKFLNQEGELPDIITVRRFALHDASELRSSLMDLSRTNAAFSIYMSFLENYKNPDNTISWLPIGGEAECLVANKKLFDKYGIPIPKDYAGLKKAFAEFTRHGVKPFASDFLHDYSSLSMLQGLSIPELVLREGQSWRQSFEEGGVNMGLDKKIWLQVFRNMEGFIKDAGLNAKDASMSYEQMDKLWLANKVAMIKTTIPLAHENVRRHGMDLVILPYFSQTGGLDWLLTYPSFQIALNKKLEQDDTRRQRAIKVLETMMSEKAQKIISFNDDVISYSRNSVYEMSPILESIKPQIDNNRMYVRLASNNFFSGSKLAVTKLLCGQATAEEAYQEMDAYLRRPKDVSISNIKPLTEQVPVNASWSEGYSAMTNTLQRIYDADVVLAAGYSFTGPVLNAVYSDKMIQSLIIPNNLVALTKEMTGEELEALLKLYVEQVDNKNHSLVQCFNKYLLPITSGVQVEVKQEKQHEFKLLRVLREGKPLDKKASYRVVVLDKYSLFMPRANMLNVAQGVNAFELNKSLVRSVWLNYFRNGGKLQLASECLIIK